MNGLFSSWIQMAKSQRSSWGHLTISKIKEAHNALEEFSFIRKHGTVILRDFTGEFLPPKIKYLAPPIDLNPFQETHESSDKIIPKTIIFSPKKYETILAVNINKDDEEITEEIILAWGDAENILTFQTIVDGANFRLVSPSCECVHEDTFKILIDEVPTYFRKNAMFFFTPDVLVRLTHVKKELSKYFKLEDRKIFGFPFHILEWTWHKNWKPYIVFGNLKHAYLFDTLDVLLDIEKYRSQLFDKDFLKIRIVECIDVQIAEPTAFSVWFEESEGEHDDSME